MKTFYKPNLEVADIFNQFGHLLGPLPRNQRKVVQDIKNCRTSVLGGHNLKCDQCEYQKNSYNSCRNRHCSKCQFMAQVRWIEKRKEDLLPCQYFHVVFTVPSQLNPLILRNKKDSYNILFKAASETLKEVAENPKRLGADIGFIGVLHSWGQNLLDHPHIHFIVPGGGLNKKKTKWLPCKKNYFLPVQVLSKVFRGKVLNYFEKAFTNKKLSFMGQIEYLSSYANFKELLITCASKEWVIYSKESFDGPKQVINYLGQYTHRIAISNYRLVKVENERVFFKVRDRDNPKKKKTMSVHGKEFMRRFLLHVLPPRYVRIRHFGLLGNRLKKMKIDIIRRLQGIKEKIKEQLKQTWKELLETFTGIDADLCPKCMKGCLIRTRRIIPVVNSP
ncbi:MAG: IS91 family transposase [Candidatus Altiarchaeota archaeon]